MTEKELEELADQEWDDMKSGIYVDQWGVFHIGIKSYLNAAPSPTTLEKEMTYHERLTDD